MTPEEALKIDPARYSVHGDVATALRVLADALREAQATVAQMREDAARVVMREAANYETAIQKAVGDPAQLDRWSDCRDELAELAAAIRALPAPAVAPAVAPKPGSTPLPERVRQYHGLDEKPAAFDAEAFGMALVEGLTHRNGLMAVEAPGSELHVVRAAAIHALEVARGNKR